MTLHLSPANLEAGVKRRRDMNFIFYLLLSG